MFRPKFITFDCYGTLTNFQMSRMTREIFADRVPKDRMDAFVADFGWYRFDEILGAWKPYRDVIVSACERTCKLWNVRFDAKEAEKFYIDIPNWGPHADVPAPLARVATKIPLVILSNASNNQIQHNVDKLGAPFHAVYTAEMAQAYKPRYRAFEFMFDKLGCSPAEMMHVSSSVKYDHMSAYALKYGARVFVARGHDIPSPGYGYSEIKDIGGLPALVGL
jgi:2-haloacid dehalogenase